MPVSVMLAVLKNFFRKKFSCVIETKAEEKMLLVFVERLSNRVLSLSVRYVVRGPNGTGSR